MDAVRYCSKTGNTKTIAEAIARGAEVTAVSVTKEPELKEHVDTLFLGGAPYANIMAPELRAYAEGIRKEMVDRVVLFTTSNWSKRTVKALMKIFKEKGIAVEEEFFYAQMFKVQKKVGEAEEFGRRMS